MQKRERYAYWKDKDNQKKFFDQLAIKWNIQKPEDWTKVTTAAVVKEGGGFVSHYYNSSLLQGTNVSLHTLIFTSITSGISKLRVRKICVLERQRQPKEIL